MQTDFLDGIIMLVVGKHLIKSSNEIFSYDWDLSEFDGTRLNSEFNAKCNYNYKFPIKTEMGLLYNFAKQLPKLNEQEVGIFVELL